MVKLILEKNTKCYYQEFDISDHTQIEQFIDERNELLENRIDILINMVLSR